MDRSAFVQRLIAWVALAIITIGAVVALVGLYLMIFYVSAIGCFLILISILIMHIMFRKYGEV